MSGTYPVALARDVQAASVVRASLEGLELVLWRDDENVIHVWEDRCPHRSVRLSAGRNLGHGVQGVYHGWTFGKDASAVNVPAEGNKAFPKIKVRVVAFEAQGGLVWASLGSSVKVPELGPEKPNGTLLRPIFVDAAADVTGRALRRLPQVAAIVTPTSDDTCTIFGKASGEPGSSPVETARTWDYELTNLRRAVEEGA